MADDKVMSLFEEAEIPQITVVNRNDPGADNNLIRCHWVNYEDTTMEDPLSLFDGYQDLKVISFSYNFGFVARITEKFEEAQIILGAEFVASKLNQTLANQMDEILATADELRLSLHRNKKLAKRVVEEEVEIRCPMAMIDHRKIYLLKADDGRTRTIMPSANLSARAWTGFNQIENFVVSDDPATYNAYLTEFETAWELSESVLPNARVEKEVRDTPMEELPDKDIAGVETDIYSVKDDNPILENIQKSITDKAIIVREVDDPETKLEIVEYNKDMEKLKQFHGEISKELKLSSKNGVIQLVPNIIKKYLFNANKVSMKRVSIEKKSADYPRMTIDYPTNSIIMDGQKVDLYPSDEEVKSDIRELLTVFSNFDNFIGRVDQAKDNYYKLMNALFSSPFNAKLRCAAYLRDVGTSGLPLYVLLNSPKSNCGKTFMVRYFLKMMTGKKRLGYKFDKVKSKELEAFQMSEKVQHKGIPIFIDEITSSFKIAFAGMIRTVDSCEADLREYQPMTVFASNVVSDPDETLRKRMIFMNFDIGLPSKVIPREMDTKGRQLINRIGTAFYRKYLSYMLPYVAGELNKLDTGEGLTDKYSPELMQKSSEIIIQIVKEYGFDVPDYMKVLTWDTDYADNSRSVYTEELDRMIELYKTEEKLFYIDEKYVTICLSNDKTGQKMVSNWVSLLPREIQAEKLPDANNAKIRMNRAELEHHLAKHQPGFRFDTGIRAKIKNWLT